MHSLTMGAPTLSSIASLLIGLILKVFQSKLVSKRSEAVKNQWSGSDIEVDAAYMLSDLNQTEQVLPETVDVSEYPHLHDLTFPEVDLHRVSVI